MSDLTYDPESHYDRVIEAWSLLLGDEVHYGAFATGEESLADASAALTRHMVDAAALRPGLRVLDVGCGTGTPACLLAGEHGVEVVGITTSSVGVAAAAARAERAGLSGSATFVVADGMDNGLPDASFDRAWVLESSHLMRSRDALLAECSRVLRPGGRLVLCDIVLQRPMPFDDVRRLREPLALLRDVFGDARMETLDTYRALAEASGLVAGAATDLTAATRPTFDRWLANAAEHRAAVVASIGQDGWQQFVDACGVLAGFWDDGTLGYGLLTADKP